jgi:hypothetical protein
MVFSSDGEYRLLGLATRIDMACGDGNFHENRFVNVLDAAYREWISNRGFERSANASAGGSHQVLLAVEGTRLDGQNTPIHHEILVPAEAHRLIVTMNHEVGGWDPEPGNLDLQLELDANCSRFVGAEVCTVNNPEPGLITVGVARVHKQVAYQLTAVATFNIAE